MVSGEVVRVSSVGTATSSTNFNPSHWRPWFGQTGAFSDPVALFRNLEGRNNIKLRRTVEELRGRTNFAAFWVAIKRPLINVPRITEVVPGTEHPRPRNPEPFPRIHKLRIVI